MKSLSAFPVALSLALLCGAVAAQDRANTTLVQKSKANATASSKAARAAAQTPMAPSGANAVGTGVKHGSPTNDRSAPSYERSHEGCQGKDVDAESGRLSQALRPSANAPRSAVPTALAGECPWVRAKGDRP